MNAVDDICAFAARRLIDTPLTFAVVVWVAGQASAPEAVALTADPANAAEATTALRCAADAYDIKQRLERP